MSGLLLDTCAVLWTGQNEKMSRSSLTAIASALKQGELFASPFSAWEISLLSARGRISLSMDIDTWFESYLRKGGIGLAQPSVRILIGANQLPGAPPNDPADRIIISTARQLNLAIVTRDRLILDYGNAGLVQTVPC